jgi:two-component system response regulator AlgR
MINEKLPKTVIIFLTAHDQFALPAFEVQAVDYLLKPVANERLQQALGRVTDKQQQRLTIKDGHRLLSVPVNEIICFQAEDKYVTAYLSDCDYLLDQSLTELAQSYRQFIRIHRSWLINVNFLRGISSGESNLYTALLKHTELQPPISRRQLSEVKKYIQT